MKSKPYQGQQTSTPHFSDPYLLAPSPPARCAAATPTYCCLVCVKENILKPSLKNSDPSLPLAIGDTIGKNITLIFQFLKCETELAGLCDPVICVLSNFTPLLCFLWDLELKTCIVFTYKFYLSFARSLGFFMSQLQK